MSVTSPNPLDEVRARIKAILPTMIERIILSNDSMMTLSELTLEDRCSLFDCNADNGFNVKRFIKKVLKVDYQTSTFIYWLAIIDKFCLLSVNIRMRNCHRILSVSFLIASKMNEDDIYKDKDIASICSIPYTELAKLETEILEHMDYNVYLSKDCLYCYIRSIWNL
jgi:hypothetical protein